jgi:hypothetical protein
MTSETKDPGASEFEKFDAIVGKLLSVPRKELQKREKQYQRKRKRKNGVVR